MHVLEGRALSCSPRLVLGQVAVLCDRIHTRDFQPSRSLSILADISSEVRPPPDFHRIPSQSLPNGEVLAAGNWAGDHLSG